jgi:hypothetical protein
MPQWFIVNHPASYSLGTRGSFPGGKEAEAWSWPLTPSSAEVKKCVELYLHSPNTPPWRGAQLKYRDNFTFTFYLNDMFRRKLVNIKVTELYVTPSTTVVYSSIS